MAKKRKKRNIQKRKKRKKPSPEEDRLGKLEPMHKFFLNPYTDQRYTRCPGCLGKTKARKKPFLTHIDPQIMLVLNMTGKYCPDCDLMIIHQDRLETMLVMTFEQRDPSVIGNEYLVLGTLERAYWRDRVKARAEDKAIFDHLHDFIDYVRYEPMYPVWTSDDEGINE